MRAARVRALEPASTKSVCRRLDAPIIPFQIVLTSQSALPSERDVTNHSAQKRKQTVTADTQLTAGALIGP
jgi:hypothetical protein